jgi:hypothetical protein
MMALPPKVRERVDHFFKTHQIWLTNILKRGVARGEFKLPAPAPKVARFVFGALQGALLVKRTTNDPSQINDVIAVTKLQLAGALTRSRVRPVKMSHVDTKQASTFAKCPLCKPDRRFAAKRPILHSRLA